MMISAKKQKLHSYLLTLSSSDNWEQARTEWKHTDITYNNNTQHCHCSQVIKNVCHITNQINGNVAEIGNDCILEFLEVDCGNTFNGIKRLIADPVNAKPNTDLINISYKLGYIYQSEYDFLMSVRNKRKTSYKQNNWIAKINNRIINKTGINKNNNKGI